MQVQCQISNLATTSHVYAPYVGLRLRDECQRLCVWSCILSGLIGPDSAPASLVYFGSRGILLG